MHMHSYRVCNEIPHFNSSSEAFPCVFLCMHVSAGTREMQLVKLRQLERGMRFLRARKPHAPFAYIGLGCPEIIHLTTTDFEQHPLCLEMLNQGRFAWLVHRKLCHREAVRWCPP